jgi:hypothetical protein
MSKEKLLKNIEEGLLNYYLVKDYSVDKDTASEAVDMYEGQSKKYQKIVKQILFKAKTHIQKTRVTKIISLAEATGRLKALEDNNKGNVFSIFKKHVEKHGLAANYRNFDKMTEKEMSNILNQLDLTALFDEIDANLEHE